MTKFYTYYTSLSRLLRHFIKIFFKMKNSGEKTSRPSVEYSYFYLVYSVLNATTGSFLEALLDGIIPAIRVNRTLIATKINATVIGRTALRLAIPVNACKIRFIGIQSIQVNITPTRPANRPISTVSALNMLETFDFEAPIALRIPISLVLS